MTAGERLIQQGEERGVQKTQHQVLLRLLRQRFENQLNAEAERRLAQASSDQITIWLDRVLSAGTLEELLAE
jgi:hypothetical protein